MHIAVNQHLGQVISQSWGATENTLMTTQGQQVVAAFEQNYQNAANAQITVLASAGDTGAANVDQNGSFYPFPTVIYPASSAWVTAVGGTSLTADTQGNYQSETVWNNSSGAGGGGVSQLFAEPSFQTSNLPPADQQILNGFRGIPDVGYNADPHTGILVYESFVQPAGFYFIGGTSEGAPQWAGIVSVVNQAIGHPLGYLNPKLYSLGNSSRYGRISHDVTTGNNSFAGITGYSATVGWDPTTGWGSPKGAGSLVPKLVRLG